MTGDSPTCFCSRSVALSHIGGLWKTRQYHRAKMSVEKANNIFILWWNSMISQTPERASGILRVSRIYFENHCSRSWAGTFVFSVKAYIVCILDFVAHLVSLEMTQFCSFTRKATTGNTKQWARLCCIWPMGCSVPVPAPDSGKNQDVNCSLHVHTACSLPSSRVRSLLSHRDLLWWTHCHVAQPITWSPTILLILLHPIHHDLTYCWFLSDSPARTGAPWGQWWIILLSAICLVSRTMPNRQ